MIKKILKVPKMILIALLVLIGVRAVLPEAIRSSLNWYLGGQLENYTGHIGDFDLSLYRGAYQIEDLIFKKKNASEKTPPFIELEEADISISWRGLWNGKVLLDVELEGFRVHFVDSGTKSQDQFGADEDSSNWKAVLDKLVPFRINNASLEDSSLYFQNFTKKPQVNLFLHDIEAELRDFSNMKDSDQLVSSVAGSAQVMGNAQIKFDAKYNSFAEKMDLEGSAKLDRLDLKQLNPFFKHYVGFDVHKGSLRAFSEAKVVDNKIDAYVKPFVENIDVLKTPEDAGSVKEIAVEVFAAVGVWLAKNSNSEKSAFIVPIKGSLDDPKVKVWDTVKSGLINGFIKPLPEKFEELLD